MKTVYLSPSTQKNNIGVLMFGTESAYCNKVVDAIIPILELNNVKVFRNKPEMTLSQVVEDSNRISPDIHVSLHTNASDGNSAGCEVFCYKFGTDGERLASLIYQNISKITPSNDRGVKQGLNFYGDGKSMYELERTKSTAVLAEIDFHDNRNSVKWLQENIDIIAKNISYAILEYFGIDKKIDAHWAEQWYNYLVNNGITINERRFDDNMTRGETFKVMAEILKSIVG